MNRFLRFAWRVIALLGTAGTPWLPAYAQIIASPAATPANRPAVTQSANGLPVVEIATPNAAGVSSNLYEQYNVGSQGLILNNAQGNAPTQLAGYVAGNPYLASGSARIIVNQVVAGPASQLRGYTEVAGPQAQVVVANPAGITCSGCGVINATRGVLTTGTPVYSADGDLDAFHVTGGQIQIGESGLHGRINGVLGGGLSGSNIDAVDLIARSVKINDSLWARRSIDVVTGVNDVRYADAGATALTPDGNAPAVAIDVGQLGGMYADKISLVGMESGVGVNSVGTIKAQAGNFLLDSQGKVTLGGTASASGNLSVASASDVSNAGSLFAARNATIHSQGRVTNTGALAALGNATLSATNAIDNTSGQINAQRDLTIAANAIMNHGTITAGGALATQSSTLVNSGTIAGANVSLDATQWLRNIGTSALIGATDHAGTLELLSNAIDNRDDTTATDAPARTTLYGLGGVVLAGGRDASGRYMNADSVRNQSARIQSAGEMLIAANLVTNGRRVMSTSGWAPGVDANLLASRGISLSGRTGRVNVKDRASIGGVYMEPPHGGEMNSDYRFTTYTGVAEARTISQVSPASQIVAGGNLNAASVGTFQNYWSRVAAAGNIVSPRVLDQDSWRGDTAPQVRVTYSGRYHYRNYDGSVPDWTHSFCPRGCDVPADIKVYALPGYESSFSANGALTGTGVSIHNTAGNASLASLGVAQGTAVDGGVMVDPVLAHATAANVLDRLRMPDGGLFKADAAPDAPYLIETNAAFTHLTRWLSSDYYFQQLGMDPAQIRKRLGDGFYEQHLVQQQVLSLTGKPVLTNGAELQGEFLALMTSGAALAKQLDLAPGLALSPEQVSQLTTNVVMMQTRVVDGQSVLVPVVYLARASQQNMGIGPVIAATDLDLDNAQTVSNSGTISASNRLSIAGQRIDSTHGTLQSGGLMTLATAGDINLSSANVKAGALNLDAGGKLILDTAAQTVSQVNDNGATRNTTTPDRGASITVAGDATIATGGNFEQNAGSLDVGGDLGMRVGGDWTLGVQQAGETKFVSRDGGVSHTHIVSDIGSGVKVGGASSIDVRGDLTARGAQIDLDGGGTIAAGGHLSLLADTATSTLDSSSAGEHHGYRHAERLDTSDDTVTGTTLQSGQSLNVVAGGTINIIGSTVNLAQGNATLSAGERVNIGAATETHISASSEQHQHRNVAGSASEAHRVDQTTQTARGSTLSADNVSVVSGKDIDITGSHVVASHDIALAAQGGVSVVAGTDTYQDATFHEFRHSGFASTGGIGVRYGSSAQTEQYNADSVIQHLSRSGILAGGDVTLVAKRVVSVKGSDLSAAKDLALIGQTLDIEPGSDVTHSSARHSANQSGVSLAVGGAAGNAAATVRQSVSQASQTSNSRLAALDVAQASLSAYGTQQAATQYAGSRATSGQPLVKVSVGVGGGSSRSEWQSSAVTNKGSSLQGGDTVLLVATGRDNKEASGVATDGDINAVGAKVSGAYVVLNAARDIKLERAADVSRQTSRNHGSQASIGVGFGLGGQQNGFTLELGASGTQGHANGSRSTHLDTSVVASDTLSIASGRDTSLRGARTWGDRVEASVGRDLHIATEQDTSTYDSKQISAGLQASLCIPPFCYGTTVSGDASANLHSTQNNFSSIVQQSGIYAGNRGFDIAAGAHTQLDGGVIASAASADQNTLSTQSLGYSNLQNSAGYTGAALGFNLSGAAGSSTASGINAASPVQPTGRIGTGPLNSEGLGPRGLGIAGVSGHKSGVTHAAVDAGTITVRDDAATGRDSTAGLSRDAAHANAAVQDTFSAEKVQDDLAIQQQTGQVGMQLAGNVATYFENKANTEVDRARQALDAATVSGDADAIAQAQKGLNAADQQAALWSSDGAARMAMHTVVAGAGAAMGGGDIAGAVSGTVTGDLAVRYTDDVTGNPLGDTLLANIASGAAGALTGEVLAGPAGALSGANGAASADLYNRQLHSSEKKAIRDAANGNKATEDKLTRAACYVAHCWAQYSPNSDEWSETYVSPAQAAELAEALRWVRSQNARHGLFEYTAIQNARDFAHSQVNRAVRGAKSASAQFVGLMNASGGQTAPSDADRLIDALNAGQPPPGSAPAVVTPPRVLCRGPACVVSPPVLRSPAYAPGHIVFNRSDGGGARDDNSLLDAKAERHILYGDGRTSGGHLSGIGKPGKTEFPSTWSSQDITNTISDIATDPQAQWHPTQHNGYVAAASAVDGVEIRVVFDPTLKRIVTGYPTNLPRNPK